MFNLLLLLLLITSVIADLVPWQADPSLYKHCDNVYINMNGIAINGFCDWFLTKNFKYNGYTVAEEIMIIDTRLTCSHICPKQCKCYDENVKYCHGSLTTGNVCYTETKPSPLWGQYFEYYFTGHQLNVTFLYVFKQEDVDIMNKPTKFQVNKKIYELISQCSDRLQLAAVYFNCKN